MNRWILVATAALMLSAGGLSIASPLRKSPEFKRVSVAPLDTLFLPDTFKGGERSAVIAIGNYNSFVGLYVYDSYGNCVARDDEATASTRDDLAVEWVPGTTGEYTVELRNFGVYSNVARVAMR